MTHGSVRRAENDPRISQESLFTADLLVVPPTEGPVVPTAAVLTQADGQTVVRLEDGTLLQVDVVASVDGRSVVKGLDVGAVIRLVEDPGPRQSRFMGSLAVRGGGGCRGRDVVARRRWWPSHGGGAG